MALKKWLVFKKVYRSLKLTGSSCFFLFHLHDPKPKQDHQIASNRMKTRSIQSQKCVKYINCIKRNTDMNTGDLKILLKKCPKNGDFANVIFHFSKVLCGLPSTLCLTGKL